MGDPKSRPYPPPPPQRYKIGKIYTIWDTHTNKMCSPPPPPSPLIQRLTESLRNFWTKTKLKYVRLPPNIKQLDMECPGIKIFI